MFHTRILHATFFTLILAAEFLTRVLSPCQCSYPSETPFKWVMKPSSRDATKKHRTSPTAIVELMINWATHVIAKVQSFSNTKQAYNQTVRMAYLVLTTSRPGFWGLMVRLKFPSNRFRASSERRTHTYRIPVPPQT